MIQTVGIAMVAAPALAGIVGVVVYVTRESIRYGDTLDWVLAACGWMMILGFLITALSA